MTDFRGGGGGQHKWPVAAELFPCGQTDVTKLIVAFSNIANACKKTFRIIGVTVYRIFSPC